MADRKSMSLKLSPKDEFPSDVHVNDVTCIEPSDVECRPFHKVTCCFALFLLNNGHIVGVRLIFTTFPYISKRYGEGSLGKNPNLRGRFQTINQRITHHWFFATFRPFLVLSRYCTLLRYSIPFKSGKTLNSSTT